LNEETKALFDVENFKRLNKPKATSVAGSFSNNIGGYEYIDQLLLHPVKDGRHRLLWLVLAPYTVNVMKLERDTAVAMIEEYLGECCELEQSDVIGLVGYYVDRSITEGLMPPHLDTIEATDPDLFQTIIETIGVEE
jgi:hypothetical protein